MPTYRRWIFEVDAPRDEFARHMKRALANRGVLVRPARVFDFGAEAWGARGFVKLAHHDRGIEAFVKLKSGVFGSATALEEALLAAGREAQATFYE